MCEPTSLAIASTALAVGREISASQANARDRRENARAAQEAHDINVYDLNARMAEEAEAGAYEREDGRRRGQEVRSEVTSSAAEAGVAGQSVDAMISQVLRDEADFNMSIKRNQEITYEQLQRMKLGADAERRNRVNAVPRYNMAGGALRIGSTLLDLGMQRHLSQPPGAGGNK